MTLLVPVKLHERVQPIVLPDHGTRWNPANPYSQLTIESLIQQQLAVMAMQLEVLGGAPLTMAQAQPAL